jgi:hypothetical protein
MFPNGFSIPHAVLVQAQRRLTVLRKGFHWPALHIQGDDLLRTPLHPIGYQHGIGARELRIGKAHHEPDCAEPRNAHAQRKRPGRFVLHGHGPVCGGRDERHQVFHGNVWPLQPEGFACRILEAKAIGLQISVLLQPAAPVFVAVAGHGHQLFGKIPTIEQEHTQWDFVPYRGLQQVNAEIDLRAKLRGQLLKVRVFSHEGVYFLVEPRPVFLLGGDGAVGKVFVDERFPTGALFIAPRQAEVHGKTPRTIDVMAGDGIVGKRRRILAMMVMAVDIVAQTPDMRAQGVIKHQEPVCFRPADCLRLLEQRHEPTLIDTFLAPRSVREKTGQIGFVRTF